MCDLNHQIPKHIKRGKNSWERSYAELMGTVIICIFRMLRSDASEQQLQPMETTRAWQAEGNRTHNLKRQKSPGRVLSTRHGSPLNTDRKFRVLSVLGARRQHTRNSPPGDFRDTVMTHTATKRQLPQLCPDHRDTWIPAVSDSPPADWEAESSRGLLVAAGPAFSWQLPWRFSFLPCW